MTTINVDLRMALDELGSHVIPAHVRAEVAHAVTQVGPGGESFVLVQTAARYVLPGGVGELEAEPTAPGNALRIRFHSGLPTPLEMFVLVPPAPATVELTDLVRVSPDDLVSPAEPSIPLWESTLSTLVAGEVADAVDGHTPGSSLIYNERTTPATSTDSTAYNITSMLGTCVGAGRPVEIEFWVPEVYHTVAGTKVTIAVTYSKNGVGQGYVSMAQATSPEADRGSACSVKRQLVLEDGATYQFLPGMVGNGPGTSVLNPTGLLPMFLSVVSR